MQIDWFTFAAQIVNFLILVALLQHFLYGPILAAMQKREEKIANRLNEAAEKKAQAEREAEQYRQKNREFDEQREQRLQGVNDEAEEQRRQLIEQARREADAMRQKWRDAFEHEKETLLRDIQQRIGWQVAQIARQMLRELANAELEQWVIERFLDRLRELDETSRKELVAQWQQEDERILLASAFEVSQDNRRRIQEILAEQLETDSRIRFETNPELICGMELRAGGRKIAWSVTDYLNCLEEEFAAKIAEQATSSSQAGS